MIYGNFIVSQKELTKIKCFDFFLNMKISRIIIQQIALNYSLDIGFQYFINIYEKCTARSYLFLASDNHDSEKIF